MEERAFLIYHASAGTGKTFALVRDYVVMLLQGEGAVFRNVLAVTFTNKATAEMKGRILKVLYGLSLLEDPSAQEDPVAREALAYVGTFPASLREDLPSLARKAREALRRILYHYPAFAVMTIDSFFQRVLRGFARELSLPFAYEMEFDEERVLDEIVEMLFAKADEDGALLDWLIHMLDDPANDTGQWNIRQILKDQGSYIFSENFRSLPQKTLERLTDRSFLKEMIRTTYRMIERFEKAMRSYGEEGERLIREAGVEVKDFKNGERGVAGTFKKLRELRFRTDWEPDTPAIRAVLKDPDEWLSKPKRKDPLLMSLVHERLHPLLLQILEHYQREGRDYHTARLVRKKLHILGVLADMRSLLFQWIRENDTLLIGETGHFLREVIRDNEAPFIYEKIGQFFRHYMIDEFQDTSRVQYEDLLPLLRESIAAGGHSLIVGDVKQSLYRWRNSDWRIMHIDLPRDLRRENIREIPLNVNYRSRKQIVRFNNAFFVTVPEELWALYAGKLPDREELARSLAEKYELLKKIYSREEVEQKVRERAEGGYVRVERIEAGEDTGWKERALEATGALIDRLVGEEGWNPGRIMILVRQNRDGRQVVRYLLERQNLVADRPSYSVVSQDSLYLSASRDVRFLIAFFRYLLRPDDPLTFATLWTLHHRLTGEDDRPPLPALHELLSGLPPERWLSLLDGTLEEGWLARLRKAPLTEAVREVIQHFSLDRHPGEIPFLHAFQNEVNDLVGRQGGGMHTLLEWWDEEGKERSVQMPEEVDAVKVYTIHKAKGLDADVVIMPLADWPFEVWGGGGSVLWCRTGRDPFARAELLPVPYSSQLLKTHFADDYLEERFNAYLDNLNLLYVAFTRARERMYVFMPAKGGPVAALIRNTLNKMLQGGEEIAVTDPPSLREEEEGRVIVAGAPFPPGPGERPRTRTVDTFPASAALGRLRVTRRGKEYFILEKGGYREKIDTGTLYHTILAGVVTAGDVERAVGKVVREGLVPASGKESLVKEIRQIIASAPDRRWFDGSYEVRAEQTLILPSGHTLRPDRVMTHGEEAVVVDYKFGTNVEPDHERQVGEYMKVLKDMGYRQVKGVLWYVHLGKTVEVHG